MKLNELTPHVAKHLVRHKWETPRQVVFYLKKSGYVEIGKGNYASAWSKRGTNSIVKVSGFEDRGWLHFLEFIKENKSPYLPKVSRVIKYVTDFSDGIKDTNYIAFMERLEHMGITLEDNCMAVIYAFTKLYNGSEFDILEIEKHLFAKYKAHDTSYRYLRALEFFEKKFPGFNELIFKIIRSNPTIDLHERNIMCRSNGTPVITDPWAD